MRINGKDFMGGDVQSATKNLPADVVENIQMIDDYGDQPRIVRRVTIDGPVSVGIDGRHGTRRSSATQVTAAA